MNNEFFLMGLLVVVVFAFAPQLLRFAGNNGNAAERLRFFFIFFLRAIRVKRMLLKSGTIQENLIDTFYEY